MRMRSDQESGFGMSLIKSDKEFGALNKVQLLRNVRPCLFQKAWVRLVNIDGPKWHLISFSDKIKSIVI